MLAYMGAGSVGTLALRMLTHTTNVGSIRKQQIMDADCPPRGQQSNYWNTARICPATSTIQSNVESVPERGSRVSYGVFTLSVCVHALAIRARTICSNAYSTRLGTLSYSRLAYIGAGLVGILALRMLTHTP